MKSESQTVIEYDYLISERERLYDLLRRIRASSRESILDIPDIAHAIEAEISEALGESEDGTL